MYPHALGAAGKVQRTKVHINVQRSVPEFLEGPNGRKPGVIDDDIDTAIHAFSFSGKSLDLIK